MPHRRQVELSDEDFWALTSLATQNNRSFKEQANYLLHEAIRGALARLERLKDTESDHAVVAA